MSDIFESVKNDDLQAVEKDLSQGVVDIDAKYENGQTFLHIAAMNGYLEIVKVLLNNEAKVNAENKDGITPLHFAASKGHLEIVKLLIENKARISQPDHAGGQTPLHWAVLGNHLDVAKLLIEKGASIDVKSDSGQTPLWFAVGNGYLEIAKLLIKNGANIKVEWNGRSLLYCAQTCGFSEIAKLLGEKGTFDVILVDAGTNKFNIIKIVHAVTGLGIAESKSFIERGGVVKEGLPKTDAERLKKDLEEAGAKVVLKESSFSGGIYNSSPTISTTNSHEYSTSKKELIVMIIGAIIGGFIGFVIGTGNHAKNEEILLLTYVFAFLGIGLGTFWEMVKNYFDMGGKNFFINEMKESIEENKAKESDKDFGCIYGIFVGLCKWVFIGFLLVVLWLIKSPFVAIYQLWYEGIASIKSIVISVLIILSIFIAIFGYTKADNSISTLKSSHKTETLAKGRQMQTSTLTFDNSFSSLKITAPELAYIPVKSENGFYKYISLSGKTITNAIFKNAYMFSEGLAMVQLQNDSYAFIDTLGNQTACCYDLATQFKEGVAWVLNGDDIKLIDNKGNKNHETPTGIDAVWSFYEGYALFSAYGKQSYVDKRFNFIGGGIYYVDGNRFQEGFAGVKCDNGKYGFINNAGKFAISCEYDEVKGFKNGLAVVKKGKSWGAINKNGSIAINLNSNIELLISDGDLFRFQDKSTKKWGWLNNKGQIVINAIFEESNPFFSNSIAPVRYNGAWVFIGKKGNYPIRTQFKYAYPFYNERAVVQFADDTWGTIDSSGDIKLKTGYTKLAPSYWNLAVSGAHSGPKLEKKGK